MNQAASNDIATWIRSRPAGWLVFSPEESAALKRLLDEKEAERMDMPVDGATAPASAPATQEEAAISPPQCRMARSALRWSMKDLADASGISLSTIKRFEEGGSVKGSNVSMLEHALVEAGMIFVAADDTSGPGVRLRQPSGEAHHRMDETGSGT